MERFPPGLTYPGKLTKQHYTVYTKLHFKHYHKLLKACKLQAALAINALGSQIGILRLKTAWEHVLQCGTDGVKGREEVNLVNWTVMAEDLGFQTSHGQPWGCSKGRPPR